MTSIVIAGYLRSPFQFARKGGLINLRPDDLAAQVLRGLVEKLDLDPALLEDVIMGCAYPEGEQGTNVARIASFRAGFPETLGGVTVNRFCGSSMTAIHFAAGQLLLGAGEAYIAAGVESMTRVPMGGFTPSPLGWLLSFGRGPEAINEVALLCLAMILLLSWGQRRSKPSNAPLPL